MSSHAFHSWGALHCHRNLLCFKIFTNYLQISATDVEMPRHTRLPSFAIPAKFLLYASQATSYEGVNFRVNVIQSYTSTDCSFFSHQQFISHPSRLLRIKTNFINQNDMWSMRVEWMELYWAVKQITLSALFPISWTWCLLYSSVINSRRLGKRFYPLTHIGSSLWTWNDKCLWEIRGNFFWKFSLITVCLCAIEFAFLVLQRSNRT